MSKDFNDLYHELYLVLDEIVNFIDNQQYANAIDLFEKHESICEELKKIKELESQEQIASDEASYKEAKGM